MSKKLIFAAPLCALILIFASCSLFSDDNEGTSVSFTIDSKTAQKLMRSSGAGGSENSRAGLQDLNGLYINMCLRGSYEDSQFAQITSAGLTLSFDGIPVGENIYAYAEIYSTPQSIQYKGRSQTIEIERGDNELQLNLLDVQTFASRYPNEPANTNNPDPTAVAQGNGGGSSVPAPSDFVFVQGATITGQIGNGTGPNASSVFIENRTITIPDMYVCAHEVTQSEYEQYCKYSGSTPSNSYGLGTNYPVYYVCYLDAIIYCNLRSVAEHLDPVYYAVIDGTSDELSLNYTTGTKSYNVDDWLSLYPTYGVTKDASGKYSAYSSYSQDDRRISYPNRGITMDKTRNGYRLLTEAEWEYCARGGHGLTETQTYYSGSDTLDAVAWNYNNSGDSDRLHQKAHPVMQLDSNGLGIFDMTGNVEEWVYGWVGDDAITATTPETGYVFNSSYTSSNTAKGGYWNWSDSSCNVNRHGSYNTYSGYEVGFRICRNKDTRSLSGYNGIWSISPPACQSVAKNTGILKFFFQNNTASSIDYNSFDPSKLLIKYDGTNHSFDSATMTLDKQANGVLLQMTNPNPNTGYLWYTFYYDGVEIGYVNTNTTNN